MRRPQLRIVEYHHSATAKYVIEGARVNGKRRRYFFPTKEKAEAELGRMKIKQRKEGENALRLPDSLRIMALECAQELKPLGKTLKDATEFYIEYLRDAERSISVSALIDEYLTGQQRLNRSQAHIYRFTAAAQPLQRNLRRPASEDCHNERNRRLAARSRPVGAKREQLSISNRRAVLVRTQARIHRAQSGVVSR